MAISSEDRQAHDALRRFSFGGAPANASPAGTLGGLSGARFWRVGGGGRSLVLRRWPPSMTPTDLRGLHALLRHGADRSVDFLPLPLPATGGDSVVQLAGHCWELHPWMPGQPMPGKPSESERALAPAGAAALAGLHIAIHDFAGRPASTARPGSAGKRGRVLDQHSAGAPLDCGGALARLGISTSEALTLERRLSALAPQAAELAREAAAQATHLQMIHGDPRREHLLFSEGRVSGLVDFGAVTHDTPMVDLARWLCETVPADAAAWQSGLDAYHSVRRLSTAERKLVSTLALSGVVASGFNWIRWAQNAGLGPADQQGATARIRQVAGWVGLFAQQRHAAQVTAASGW